MKKMCLDCFWYQKDCIGEEKEYITGCTLRKNKIEFVDKATNADKAREV